MLTSRQNEWWTSLQHVLHKNFLVLGQPELERVLSQTINGGVQYDEKITFVVEEDGKVHILCASGRRMCSKYVISADGAKSTVRSSVGATYTGTNLEMLWAVIDAVVDTNLEPRKEIMLFQLQGQTRVMMILRERGRSRFYVWLDGEVTQNNAEEAIRKHVAPFWIKFKEVEWYSSFPGKPYGAWRLSATEIEATKHHCY